MTDLCKTKYPILLIHGTGFRDRKYLNYWGRIPKALENNGAAVFYGNQDSWGTIETNALFLKDSIEKILADTKCEKVNLIAHSKGGLEARFLISSLHMADKIASLTTISTPHHGSKTIDKVYRCPKFLYKTAAVFVNGWFRLLGDKHPNFYEASREFSTFYMNRFNEDNPDSESVYYQSYGSAMHNSFSDFTMILPHFVVRLIEGENDGLVTPASATWTNYKGAFMSATNRGISHGDEVDIRRMRFTKKKKSGCISDIPNKYTEIVSELKNMGL